MSVTTGVRCADCGMSAPELGDFGSMGLPSASTEERTGEQQNFGYLFLGFRAIGMVTKELVDFLEFLRKHDGHDLVMHADEEEESFDPEDSGDEEDDWGDEELWEDGESDEETSLELAAKLDALLRELQSPVEKLPDSAYVVANYELTCHDCDASFRTAMSDALQPISELAIDDARAGLFLKVVCENLDSFYRSEPFSPDDIDGVAAFLDEHIGHRLSARGAPES